MHDPNTVSDHNAPPTGAKRTLLVERPGQRGKRGVGALLFIICGCLLLLGGVGALIWQLNAPMGTSTSTAVSTAPAGSAQSGKQPVGCTGAREPVNIIQQQTAEGLHLNVAQVQARVLAGKTIVQIATEQGLTAAQLHNVEIQALHTANNRWLGMGCITAADVQENLKRDTGSAAFMDTEFTDWFKH